jgi:hypothetical protein
MSKETGDIFIKEIIKEYNVFLKAWGNSDLWDLNRFRTLGNMIYETTKLQISANTLKRFFQQKTENPQLATKDALCQLLGYSSYTDFVLQKTKKEDMQESGIKKELPVPKPINADETKENTATIDHRKTRPEKTKRRYAYILSGVCLLIAGYFLYTHKLKVWYVNHLISNIEFSASQVKGICPLTVTFSYYIPPRIFDDISIVYEESNGDIVQQKINQNLNRVNISYVYEGRGFCYLKYKDQIIKTIEIEVRKPGWSVFIREERGNVFKTLPIEKAYTDEGSISLPIEDISVEERTDKLFVSYVFYRDRLVDGDNFIFEARARNSEKEHAISCCSDIMMYIFSDKAFHGFSMNENGYSYIKFISSENTIKGDEYDLGKINFNSSEWHVMSIKVVNKETSFYVDGEKVLGMDYNNSLGLANELILRFKGCGTVDYVKIYKPDGELVYEEDFTKPIE